MPRTSCPFLGLQDDPTTALDFPSEGNYCHHAQPISPIKRAYQQAYCLTSEHTICPLYQAAQPQPLPAAMAEPSYARGLSRRKLAMIAGPLLLAGITALLLTWNVLSSQLGWLKSIPNTGSSTQSLYELSMLDSDLPEGAPSAEPTPTSSAQPLVASCPLPEGWVTYIVTPTDSLYRLSVLYGVSVADMQRMNCMGQKTTILPGQVIYVPYIPTAAPTSTDTLPAATNTLAQTNPPVSYPNNTGRSNPSSATPIPPPQIPPVQPTPVPPQPTSPPPASATNPPPPPPASSNPQPTPVPNNPPSNPPPPQPQPTNPPGNNNGGNGHGNGNGNGGNGNGNGGNGHGNGNGNGGNGNGNGGNGHGSGNGGNGNGNGNGKGGGHGH